MTEDGGKGRAKRRCASRSRSTAVPSAVHYVGYVEDDETPEMIMAKFAELEKIKHAIADKAPPTEEDAPEDPVQQQQQEQEQPDQQLNDEQLLEVFKQTSMFNVRTALDNNTMLLGIDEILEATGDRYGLDDPISDDEDVVRAFWSDEDEDWEEGGGRRKGRRGGAGRSSGGGGSRGGQRNAGAVRARHQVVTAYNPSTQALVRRRVKTSDPNEIHRISIPVPLPLSWGHSVQPYMPKEKRAQKGPAVPIVVTANTNSNCAPSTPSLPPTVSHTLSRPDTASLALVSTVTPSLHTTSGGDTAKGFQAVLINPGWAKSLTDDNSNNMEEVASVLAALPIPKLVPDGFIFIWVPKQLVMTVCKQMTKWGYLYIENLTWVYMSPTNRIVTDPSPYVGNSHMTMYIFRHAERGRGIELRHQRNPDVTFECVAAFENLDLSSDDDDDNDKNSKRGVKVPEETYVAIETLLPTGRGRFLELWAEKKVTRPGWVHVSVN
jgi:N6-adenosine-specific RNA methylase IME4